MISVRLNRVYKGNDRDKVGQSIEYRNYSDIFTALRRVRELNLSPVYSYAIHSFRNGEYPEILPVKPSYSGPRKSANKRPSMASLAKGRIVNIGEIMAKLLADTSAVSPVQQAIENEENGLDIRIEE